MPIIGLYPSYRYRTYLPHPMTYGHPIHYGGMGMPIGIVPGLGMGMGMGMGMPMPMSMPMPYPIAAPVPVPIANPVPIGVPVPASALIYGHGHGHGHGGYGMTGSPLQPLYQVSSLIFKINAPMLIQ